MRFSIQPILLAFNCMLLATLPAESLQQGAFVVLERVGDFHVYDYLEEANEAVIMPGEIKSGMAEVTATEGSSGYFLASNGMILAFKGPGSFSIERFEQTLKEAIEDDLSGGESRVILEIKNGKLLIDSTRFGSKAKVVVETAFGRMMMDENSKMLIVITENKKRKRYNLEIECSQGNARFMDRGGSMYELFTEQRLSGYSKIDSLSLSFSQLSYGGQASFRLHDEKLESLPLADYDLERFKPFMPLLGSIEGVSDGAGNIEPSSLELRRPIIIRLAPRAKPTLPIRAIKK